MGGRKHMTPAQRARLHIDRVDDLLLPQRTVDGSDEHGAVPHHGTGLAQLQVSRDALTAPPATDDDFESMGIDIPGQVSIPFPDRTDLCKAVRGLASADKRIRQAETRCKQLRIDLSKLSS